MASFVFKLPDVGEGTAEAELVTWHVKPGDVVDEDQPLVDVMTDKATVEITSPVAGVVTTIHGQPGDMAAVGSALVVLEVAGEVATAESGPQDAASLPEPARSASAEPVAALEAPAAVEPVAPDPDMAVLGSYVFKLPDVGEGTAEAELVAWKVAVGDVVAEDDPLADVMTDKATVELTSPVAGRILALNGEPGRMVAVGSALVTLEVSSAAPASTAAAPAPAAPPRSRAEDAPVARSEARREADAPASRTLTAPRPEVSRLESERVLASPAVRARARRLGVELAFVPGAGPGGRVEHADLDAYLAAGRRPVSPPGPAAPRLQKREAVEEVRVIGLRRKIAEKMQESKRRIPHFMYAEEIDATELEALRLHLNAHRREGQPKLTLLPFFVRALVKVLPEHPQINALYDDEAGVLRRFAAVHLGVATQTPNGLMVPVVRHAEGLTLWECADEIARVAAAARSGKAAREELTGSTITVTSLGPLGGLVHTPVINHPEVAIVGPNRIVERPVIRDGAVVARKMMNLSSSFDHRIVDGYDAAEFIQKIKRLLETPATLFMD